MKTALDIIKLGLNYFWYNFERSWHKCFQEGKWEKSCGSWCLSTEVPKVQMATRAKEAKGQNWVVPRRSKPELYIFNITIFWSMSACCGAWEKSGLLTLKRNLGTCCHWQSSIQSHALFEVWIPSCSSNVDYVALKKVWKPLPLLISSRSFKSHYQLNQWFSNFFKKIRQRSPSNFLNGSRSP